MKIGVIGTDSSHAVAFSRKLIAKGHQIAAYKGGSQLELSRLRIDSIATQMRQDGVLFMESIEQMEKYCDAFIITSVDADQHFEQFEQLSLWNKPVFIDKPLAQNGAEALKIIELAKKRGIPLMSSSALRFADCVQRAKKRGIKAVDIIAPLPMLHEDDYFYYGIHALEIISALKNLSIQEAIVHKQHAEHFITLTFEDRTVSTIRGFLQQRQSFQFVAHSAELSEWCTIEEGDFHFYDRIVDEMEQFFETKSSPVKPSDTLQIIGALEKITQHAKTITDF
ncbi:Gfo/Idh/MocA family oxidoreductase [Solibacillus silvestris]|uniref:Gfo/Idh/MocA family oxidoreductase n=1 Tax=Solibacillus silvestris TaxID=76853 RepID=UPI003F7D3680